MLNPTPWKLLVQSKNRIILDFKQEHPVLINDNAEYILENNKLSAWLIRTSLKKLAWTEAGKAWYSENDPLKIYIPPLLKTQLRQYQILGVARMAIGPCDDWMDMGTGKTVVALTDAIRRFVADPLNSVFLYVCPGSIFGSIITQLGEHLKIKPRVIIAHGPKKNKELIKLRTSLGPLTFVFTTYETLGSIGEAIAQLPLGAVYFDEASRIKNFETQRAQAAHWLVNKAQPSVPRFGLSGTPSTTRVTGYYSLYEILGHGKSGCPNQVTFNSKYTVTEKFFIAKLPNGTERHIFAANAENWLQKNCPPGQTQSYWNLGYSFADKPGEKKLQITRYYNKPVGTQNIDQLQEVTRQNAYVVFKEEVLNQLPPKTHMRRTIELSTDQRKAYLDIFESNRTELSGKKISFQHSAPFQKLHQIANGYLISQDGEINYFKSQPKLDELELILEEAENEKIIIWSPYIAQLNQVSEFLKKKNLSFILLRGDTKQADRLTVEQRFKTECDILLANQTVGGVGLNMWFSWFQVFMTNSPVPDIRIQAENRQHRSGQENPVTIMDIIAKNTMETKLLNTVQRNISTEQQILNVSDFLGEAA